MCGGVTHMRFSCSYVSEIPHYSLPLCFKTTHVTKFLKLVSHAHESNPSFLFFLQSVKSVVVNSNFNNAFWEKEFYGEGALTLVDVLHEDGVRQEHWALVHVTPMRSSSIVWLQTFETFLLRTTGDVITLSFCTKERKGKIRNSFHLWAVEIAWLVMKDN